MARRRREYSAQERRELWERWKRGESVSEIGRALDRAPGTITAGEDPQSPTVNDAAPWVSGHRP
jgi:hypothetical protein